MRVEDGHQPVCPCPNHLNELTCYQEPYPVWKPYETDLILPALLERLLPQE